LKTVTYVPVFLALIAPAAVLASNLGSAITSANSSQQKPSLKSVWSTPAPDAWERQVWSGDMNFAPVCWENKEDNPQGPTFTRLEGGLISPKPDETLVGGDFIMYPHAVGGYTPTWSLFDYYGGGGFSHEEKHYISRFTSLYIWGQFKQVTADPILDPKGG